MSSSHILPWAQFIASPNFNDRPDESDISLIVLHNISLPPGQFGGEEVIDFFTNQLNPHADPYFEKIHTLEVSSHLYIRRDGSVIQFVPFNKRAWHAGQSCYEQRENCNDYSIGIELEGGDDIPYEEAQYRALTQVIKYLVDKYPQLTTRRITGHEHIAPGRKTDPGPAFQWVKLVQALEGQEA